MKTRERTANLAHSVKVLGEDAVDVVRTRVRPVSPELSDRQRNALAQLDADGIAVVEGFWSREDALAMRDRLEAHLGEQDENFEGGAYLRNQGHLAVDSGVSRIYHVDKLEPELESFRFDPFVLEVAAAYYRMPFHSSMLIFQHNRPSPTGTRYFHVDSYAKEFKSFLYLDDVDEDKGPFTYVRGSHRQRGLRMKKQFLSRGADDVTSFHEDEVGSLGAEETMLCGPAGTLLLADVRGLHRGAPQLHHTRSVLVNYVTRHSTEIWPEK